MRLTITGALCLALAACVAPEKPAERRAALPPDLHRADCYTVVLYDDHPVRPPAEGVRPEHAAFLGRWTNGAWNGEWCHDLLVTEVKPDGRVELVEMHAPHLDWNMPASAFRRTGRIHNDNELRFAYGTERVSYKLVGGRMMAKRSGFLGTLRAELRRPGAMAPPRARPSREVAQVD